MLFNVKKCKVMYTGYNSVQAECVMNDVKLECASDEKNLWVIVSDDVKSGKQCSEEVKQANGVPGMKFHWQI